MRDAQHAMIVGVILISLATTLGCRNAAKRSLPRGTQPFESAIDKPSPLNRAASVARQADRIESQPERLPKFEQISNRQTASLSGHALDSTERATDVFSVDLGNALALGGASHRQVQLARERVIEAQAKWSRARFARLPSLRFGVGYNKHDGRLQETEGRILEIGRNSLFVGGGAGLGDFPLAGGASGPARLMVNLSLADAMFEPLAARQLADAAVADEAATFNDSLLSIAAAYLDLVESYAQLANSREGESAAEQMVELARLFAKSGKGARAEVYRAQAELAYWGRVRLDAQRETKSRAAELARLLSLDPLVTLVPVEERIAPIEIVPPATSADDLVLTALATRPEMARHSYVVAAMDSRLRQENLRPWLPNVQAGVSGGSFGGGRGSDFDNQASRSDVDLLAVWELRNLGLGNAALRGQRASQLRQAQVEALATRDRIVAEVKSARADVESYRQQIDSTQAGVIAAEESFRANLDLIRNAEGLPVELIQSIRARYEAQNGYARAISDHNRAQFRLLRSLGQPPS